MAFSGPRGGGKSTLAFFTALVWALTKNRQTLYTTFDMAAWTELCRRFGLDQKIAPVELERPSLSGYVSAGGPGVISIGPKSAETVGLPPDIVLAQLASVSRTHDVFFDVDERSIHGPEGQSAVKLEGPVLKKGENVFWVLDPSDPDSLSASQTDFRRLAQMGVPLNRFHVILNDLHGKGKSPEPAALRQLLGQADKSRVLLVEKFLVWKLKLTASCVDALRDIIRTLEKSEPGS